MFSKVFFLFCLAHLSYTTPTGPKAYHVAQRDEVQTNSRPRIWTPPVLSQMQMILSGWPDIDEKQPTVAPNVPAYDIDLFDTPKSTIEQLHKLGKKVVCYFSAGTAENWRPDFGSFTEEDLGAPLPLWPGERYLNIRSKNVWKIMSKRIQLAKANGCDAIDPDNIDVYSNENGGGVTPPISPKDAIRYLRKMSRLSRRYGMSIGLKNALEILPFVSRDVDFAVNEECVLSSSCGQYASFTNPRFGPGKAVFHIEYVNYTDPAPNGTTSAQQYPTPKPPQAPLNLTSWFLPDLKNDALRSKLCLKDIKEAKKWKLSTSIKTLDLDGWIMWCDGKYEATKTTEGGGEQEPEPPLDSSLPEDSLATTEDENKLEQQLESELQDVQFPQPTGTVKDTRPALRY